jgi:hypothetical protein
MGHLQFGIITDEPFFVKSFFKQPIAKSTISEYNGIIKKVSTSKSDPQYRKENPP